jgi:hypothetical protein
LVELIAIDDEEFDEWQTWVIGKRPDLREQKTMLGGWALTGERGTTSPLPNSAKITDLVTLRFDPSQPRADDGKWAKVGGGGSHGVSYEETPRAPSFEQTTREQRMGMATYKDVKAQMRTDLYEASQGGKARRLVPVSGPIGPDTVSAIASNARAQADRYGQYLAGDTAALLRDHISLVTNTLSRHTGEFAGTNAGQVDKMVRDSVDKLVYQEVESNRQQFTDHGIRHVVGNELMQSQILDTLSAQGIPVTGRERLLGLFVMTNHDVGYTHPMVRDHGDLGATKEHKEYSEKVAEEQRNEWNKDKVFSAKEYDRATHLIRTHDSTELSTKDPLALATRVADNLALFQAEKLPSVFRYVSGGRGILVKAGKAAAAKDMAAFNSSKDELNKAIAASPSLHPNMKRDLRAAVKAMNPYTPKFTMGVLAGEVTGIGHSAKAAVSVKIKYNSFDAFLARHFDMGQKQTRKILGDYGVTDYTKKHYALGDENGRSVLEIDVE